jgi:hypothetical protein
MLAVVGIVMVVATVGIVRYQRAGVLDAVDH